VRSASRARGGGRGEAGKGSAKSLLIVLRYARRYLRALLLATTSTILLVGIQLAVPWIIRILIGSVESSVSGQAAVSIVTALAGGLLGLYVVRAVLRFVSSYTAHTAGWGVVADARQDVYEHLQRLSMRFYEDQQTGQLMSRMVNDTDKFESLISHAVPETLVNALTVIGVSAVMFVMNWRLSLITLVPIPLILVAVRSYARYVRPAFHERQRQLAELNASLQDNLSGIREIKAFAREDREARRIGQKIDAYRTSLLRALRLMATFSPFVELASSLGTVVVIYFGGLLAFRQALPIGDLVAFFLYLEIFYQPVRALSGSFEQIQEARVGAERVAELLEEKPEIHDLPGARELSGKIEGAICFRGVSFRYARGETVLEDISLDIPAKSVAALVGPSGVGKTTFASLIPRFYDVGSGSVTIDGTDIRSFTVKSLRRQVSLVLQDVFLFNGSVRDNILFGRSDATEEEVAQAARVANADGFIGRLPDGYDTLIGERGVKLSGGQKQRISIARAILKDAPILILDEATSSVDTRTELLIREALERLMRGRTTIIIAHRLSTVRSADLIVVLDKRRLREVGTHEELMARNGMYRSLVAMQEAASAELGGE
jgi:ATP-binding cassette subfamily B protein